MSDLTYIVYDFARWLRAYWPEAVIVAVASAGFVTSMIALSL